MATATADVLFLIYSAWGWLLYAIKTVAVLDLL